MNYGKDYTSVTGLLSWLMETLFDESRKPLLRHRVTWPRDVKLLAQSHTALWGPVRARTQQSLPGPLSFSLASQSSDMQQLAPWTFLITFPFSNSYITNVLHKLKKKKKVTQPVGMNEAIVK